MGKAEPTEFADGLDVRCGKKRRVENGYNVCNSSNGNMELPSPDHIRGVAVSLPATWKPP